MEIKYPEIYDESYKILKSVYGDDADFRDGQYEAIEATMTNKRTLVVQRTGWGKSLVYFMCTKMFRRMNRGFTMVISPLLVLMENQAEMAKKLGIRCDVLNSTVKDRRSEILEDLANDKLYVPAHYGINNMVKYKKLMSILDMLFYRFEK